ncbi:MAG: exodeoxyribonuclease VII small subunit [Slackia sp.]|nr:exodeoxyribonuclease VII small subunit [Slackia sp.]
MVDQTHRSFSDIRDRLDEIAACVRDDATSLDAALDLYDEAVELGMQAVELIEAADAESRDRTSRGDE